MLFTKRFSHDFSKACADVRSGLMIYGFVILYARIDLQFLFYFLSVLAHHMFDVIT